MSYSEKTHQIALSRASGVGPRRYASLVRRAGSAQEVFQAGPSLWNEQKLSDKTQWILSHPQLLEIAQTEQELADKHQIRLIVQGEADYPHVLAQDHLAPIVLSVRGFLPSSPLWAVVGTRRASQLGYTACENLILQMSHKGIGVISGLARGIDRKAHHLAISSGLPNVAVLGQGLLSDLDQQGEELVQQMLETQGCVLSQFSLWSPPERGSFPARNRVVAALSEAVCLMESSLQGGGMITARLGKELSRPLWVEEGPVGCKSFEGTQWLLEQGLAHPWQEAFDLEPRFQPKQKYTSLQQKILDFVAQGIEFDELCHQSSILPGKLLALLTELEIQGALRSLPGRRYAIR